MKNTKKNKQQNASKIVLLVLGYLIMITLIAVLATGRINAAERNSAGNAESSAPESAGVYYAAYTAGGSQPESTAQESSVEAAFETEVSTEPETETSKAAAPTSADTTPPVISGAADLTVHIGDTVSYKSNITVWDDTDPAPVLEVDSSQVDLNTVGTYIVIYIAQDASGNHAYTAARVRIVPQASVTTEEAYAVADETLNYILSEDMTDKQKIAAIYDHLFSFGYVNKHYAEAVNYLDNAYYFLTTRQGDCRCFFGASKLLLERCGFRTMMIRSFTGSKVIHYWNLVSIDGGVSWYHFDPTCWGWGYDGDICMVTDEWLKDYATRHDYTPLIWDEESYPATPLEPFEW